MTYFSEIAIYAEFLYDGKAYRKLSNNMAVNSVTGQNVRFMATMKVFAL